jgi:hypothetical protein
MFEDRDLIHPYLTMNSGDVTTNIRQFMGWLTAEVDPYVTRESRIIQAEWALLENMANAPGEININD